MAYSSSVLREQNEQLVTNIRIALGDKFNELTDHDGYKALKLKKKWRDDMPGNSKYIYIDASGYLIGSPDRTSEYSLHTFTHEELIDILQSMELGSYKLTSR